MGAQARVPQSSCWTAAHHIPAANSSLRSSRTLRGVKRPTVEQPVLLKTPDDTVNEDTDTRTRERNLETPPESAGSTLLRTWFSRTGRWRWYFGVAATRGHSDAVSAGRSSGEHDTREDADGQHPQKRGRTLQVPHESTLPRAEKRSHEESTASAMSVESDATRAKTGSPDQRDGEVTLADDGEDHRNVPEYIHRLLFQLSDAAGQFN